MSRPNQPQSSPTQTRDLELNNNARLPAWHSQIEELNQTANSFAHRMMDMYEEIRTSAHEPAATRYTTGAVTQTKGAKNDETKHTKSGVPDNHYVSNTSHKRKRND